MFNLYFPYNVFRICAISKNFKGLIVCFVDKITSDLYINKSKLNPKCNVCTTADVEKQTILAQLSQNTRNSVLKF